MGEEGRRREGRGEGKGKVVPPNVRDALTPLLTHSSKYLKKKLIEHSTI